MRYISIVLAWVVLTTLTSTAVAAPPAGPLDRVRIDVTDEVSLQRGAHVFFNYCMGCHSAQHMRYNRVGRDIGLTENQVVETMIFQTDEDGELVNAGSLMTNAMSKDYGAEAFGKAPPDLTLVARIYGEDWLYTFLRGFYRDASRPLGVNNIVFENIGMPHPLWQLQGWQEKQVAEDGSVRLRIVEPGQMTGPEYDLLMRDVVTFMSYLAEPTQADRKRIGVYVMIFLFIFLLMAYLLKKEYWRDIH